jgi:hypothetical protein
MKKNYEDLFSLILRILGAIFLIILLGWGFYFVGYLFKLMLN